MKKTLDAISKLVNDSRFLTTSVFPNKENAEKCRRSLALIADLTNRIISEEENISLTYLKTLKLNFIKYMTSNDVDIPRFLLNKRSIKQVILHLSDTEIYDYPISKSDEIRDVKKILFLLETATSSKELGIEFSICILKFYYSFYNNCSNTFISNITQYLDKYYSEKYYLNHSDFISMYSQFDIGEINYSEFLRNIKINSNFISTKFFQKLWYVWCITRKPNTYSEAFLEKNKNRINAESPDVRKCLLAVITYQINKLPAGENLIKNQLLPMFGSVNPTDKSYWEISSEDFKSQYATELNAAPRIYYKYFTKTFLDNFFYVLSSGSSSYETQRAIFWMKYIDKIEDFKIAVTQNKDRIIQNRLSQLPGDTRMYLSFYRKCKIKIYRDNDPAAILIKLNDILAIEFTETGNAAYLYQKNHEFAKSLFNRYQVNGVSDFKISKDELNSLSKYNLLVKYGFLERILHNGYWQYNAESILEKNNSEF